MRLEHETGLANPAKDVFVHRPWMLHVIIQAMLNFIILYAMIKYIFYINFYRNGLFASSQPGWNLGTFSAINRTRLRCGNSKVVQTVYQSSLSAVDHYMRCDTDNTSNCLLDYRGEKTELFMAMKQETGFS